MNYGTMIYEELLPAPFESSQLSLRPFQLPLRRSQLFLRSSQLTLKPYQLPLKFYQLPLSQLATSEAFTTDSEATAAPYEAIPSLLMWLKLCILQKRSSSPMRLLLL